MQRAAARHVRGGVPGRRGRQPLLRGALAHRLRPAPRERRAHHRSAAVLRVRAAGAQAHVARSHLGGGRCVAAGGDGRRRRAHARPAQGGDRRLLLAALPLCLRLVPARRRALPAHAAPTSAAGGRRAARVRRDARKGLLRLARGAARVGRRRLALRFSESGRCADAGDAAATQGVWERAEAPGAHRGGARAGRDHRRRHHRLGKDNRALLRGVARGGRCPSLRRRHPRHLLGGVAPHHRRLRRDDGGRDKLGPVLRAARPPGAPQAGRALRGARARAPGGQAGAAATAIARPDGGHLSDDGLVL
mmetsp:Transcript_5701/g.19090  ORF Transcript_5701/g.19090 Transcript_5701/m.19090 type:complete len:305 (+) Transcript_5701:156-1070(+)